jgi:hypothetical protein
MTATSKRRLIFESVAVIQIDVHPAGKEPDQHIICMAPRVSRMTTFHEVPTWLKSGPYSRDEVLALSDRPTRPSCWVASFSLH